MKLFQGPLVAEALAVVGIAATAGVLWVGRQADLLNWAGLDIAIAVGTIACVAVCCRRYGWKRPLLLLVTIPLAVACGIAISIYLMQLGIVGVVLAIVAAVVWFAYLAWSQSRRAEI